MDGGVQDAGDKRLRQRFGAEATLCADGVDGLEGANLVHGPPQPPTSACSARQCAANPALVMRCAFSGVSIG